MPAQAFGKTEAPPSGLPRMLDHTSQWWARNGPTIEDRQYSQVYAYRYLVREHSATVQVAGFRKPYGFRFAGLTSVLSHNLSNLI